MRRNRSAGDCTTGGANTLMRAMSCRFTITFEETFCCAGGFISREEYATIHDLFVPEQHRREGYAREMLLQAIAAIRKEHKEITILIIPEPTEDEPNKSQLIAFYESVGFKFENTGVMWLKGES